MEKGDRVDMLTEEKKAGESTGKGRVNEATNTQIKTSVPFGIQVVLRWDLSCCSSLLFSH